MTPLVSVCSSKTMSRERTGFFVGLTGILLNGLIFALELVAGLSTGSMALTADAFHNLVDALSGIVTVVSFWIAEKPATRRYPFGFGRVEYLSSLLMGIAILGTGLFFARSSFQKTLRPSPVQFDAFAFGFTLIAIALKLANSLLNKKYAEKVVSQTMAAASLDALSDTCVLAVAAFSLAFARLTGITVDGPCGLAVSGFILFSGYSVAKRAIESLIGKAPDPETAKKICAVVSHAEFVAGIHGLTIHDYGPERVIASVHAEIPSDVPLAKARQAVAEAERTMKKQGVELTVHMDPA